MSADILERFVAQRFTSSSGPVTHFEWHGGEPTLAGLDFYRSVVKLQRRLAPRGRRWTNGLQTNGVALDQEWAAFLGREGFSVGLSLDGPAACHDPYRPQSDGRPTHARVLKALGLLQAHQVAVNLLCVVHDGNVQDPDGVYDFFRSLGVGYLQFLPLVPAPDRVFEGLGASAQDLGAFLCRIFDRWIAMDVGALVVQSFDEALRPYAGVPHALCVHRPTCGDVVVEHDGSVYACDHFVGPEHRLGNLADPRLVAFGQAKLKGLSQRPGRDRPSPALRGLSEVFPPR